MQWEERSVKKKVRQLLLDQLWFDRPITYIGLPAATAIFEKELVKHAEVTDALFFERDPVVMESLKDELDSEPFSSLNVSCLQGDIDEWIESRKKLNLPFWADFMWLDYCGPITTQRLTHLQAIADKMPYDGILAVTFMIGREPVDAQMLLDTSDDFTDEIDYLPSTHLSRINGIINVLKPVRSEFDILVQPYADTVPMLLVVIKKNVKVAPSRFPAFGLKYIGLDKTVVKINTFLSDPNSTNQRGRPPVPVSCEGVKFASVKEAANVLGVSASTIRSRIRNPKRKDYMRAEE